MLNQQGLSLEQAPPIWVVLRFFIGGALFGLFSGITLFYYGVDIFDPSTSGALTFTHLLTLGVMLSFMLGALFQMLPVIAGVAIESPVKKADLVQYSLAVGIFLLLLAFNYSSSWLFGAASILLGVPLLYIVTVMLKALAGVGDHSSSSRGMIVALASLGILTLLALYMTGTLAGYIEGSGYAKVKEAHYSFGLFGWVAMLIVSISFQVIEMFYVTPPYPKFVSLYLPRGMFVILSGAAIGVFILPNIYNLADVVIAIILIAYGGLTLRRLSQRKRPVTDATIWFWRIGLSALILSMLCFTVTLVMPQPWIKSLSFILYATFALSIVFAMFYKIVPFLTWFHLSSQGFYDAPMMHEIIHPKTAKKHLYIHIAALLAFLLTIIFSQMVYIAALLLCLSFCWALWQVVQADQIYTKTQKEGHRFEMMNSKE